MATPGSNICATEPSPIKFRLTVETLSVEKGGGVSPPPFLWAQATQKIFPVPKIAFKLRFVMESELAIRTYLLEFFKK